MAAVWRSTCGVTCLLAIDEPASLAAFAYLAVSQPTASELSGPPRRLGNNGSSGLPQLSRSHTRSVSTV
jgi:hypothetical protein